MPPGSGEPPVAKPQEPLVTALARAFHWQDLLDAGTYSSIGELAKALRLDRCYVRSILSLTTLAPDIVDSIVGGTEPSGLSLEKLTKTLQMPWAEQKAALGFEPPDSLID